MAKKLGEILLESGAIAPEQLEEGLDEQRRTGERLGSILIRLGHVDDDTVVDILSEQYDVLSVNLSMFDIEEDVLKFVPAEVARRYNLIPINITGGTITVAMVDPFNVFALDDLKFLTNHHIEPVVATERSINEAISRYYGESSKSLIAIPKAVATAEEGMLEESEFALDFGTEIDPETIAPEIEIKEESATLFEDDEYSDLIQQAVDDTDVAQDDEAGSDLLGDSEAPIIKLVNGVLVKAIKQGCSDIHFEPYEKEFRIRYRMDGVLRKEYSLPLKIRNAVISRLKIMAGLDISERRLPQDGRIKMRLGTRYEVDIRVSTCPVIWGEKIVLRILDKANLRLDMTQLGFTIEQLTEFQESIHKPYGMVLVTGPTGSGKTTTLYSALNQLNQIPDNIMTSEDPVEYNLTGINQVQINEAIGLTFASALRSFLRQDPDIIMVGEIRDFETAEIAIKAALTGHLVLSTIHTNDAPSTINRLLNMGIEPFLVSAAVIMIIAQRLVRLNCTDCVDVDDIPLDVLIDVGFSPKEASELKSNDLPKKGSGCSTCTDSGYKGRLALYEVMTITDEIRELVLRGASALEIKETAIAMGMHSLRDSGLDKVREGKTSIEEVVRVTFGS